MELAGEFGFAEEEGCAVGAGKGFGPAGFDLGGGGVPRGEGVFAGELGDELSCGNEVRKRDAFLGGDGGAEDGLVDGCAGVEAADFVGAGGRLGCPAEAGAECDELGGGNGGGAAGKGEQGKNRNGVSAGHVGQPTSGRRVGRLSWGC